MLAREFIVEYRDSFGWKFLKQHYPTWPDYVLYDLLLPSVRRFSQPAHLREFLKYVEREFGQLTWEYKQLHIDYTVFSEDTKKRMYNRATRLNVPFDTPRDLERHATQAQLLKQRGISQEPIILIKKPDGYDLEEGWHRTIQSLLVYPDGYTANAWVGTPV